MSFDYNKGKHTHNGDSFWTSYSDLFLGLSTIFLLLYVTASLRTGTDAIKAQVENQKLNMEVEELKGQLKMYEQIKADYLEKQASKDETQEYQELMDKLTLLKEDAKSEKEKLARQALENERKADALNKYQQMVRNIINANKVAKTKLITRNDVINEQDQTIEQQQTDITQTKQELARTEKKIAQAKAELASSRKALKKSLQEHQISEAQYQKRLHKMQEQSDSKIAALKGEADTLRDESEGLKKREVEMEGKVAGLSGKLKSTEGQLAKAKAEMDARRDIAREIKKGFGAAGIKADVDMQTGEVVIDFGDHYFESDSADLKPEMKDIIERAMPIYSKSLFGNSKVAEKISAVEIIGFASPTYRGRYVDPKSNKPEDRVALKYNMDLSYRRANSIFGYVLDGKNVDFEHRKELMGLMKVSGRSFLEVMKVQSRKPASAADFCKANDCKKAQRVIVRFSIDGK